MIRERTDRNRSISMNYDVNFDRKHFHILHNNCEKEKREHTLLAL